MSRATASAALAVVALALGAQSSAAQGLTNTERDFSFKRVKVGGASGSRILVQIDPMQQAKTLALNPAVPVAPITPLTLSPDQLEKISGIRGVPKSSGRSRGKTSHGWFWDLVSPELARSRSGRMEQAVVALANGPGGKTVRAPRLAAMQEIADRHGADILKATAGTGVSPALVLAVISIESAGKPAAVSHAGATGLMQLMPATAERFGVTNRKDPTQNIEGGVAYLDWLLNHFGRDPLMALAGYNAGENAVKKHGGIPPYAETRDYVPKVVAAWNVAKGLCMTPPQLVSDGCVFRRGVQTAARISE